MFIDKQEFLIYLFSIYGQLSCVACKEYQEECVTYAYTPEQINQHLDYFEDCMSKGLSSYKALLFFHDYLTELNCNE